jgi:hypothetical protein
MSPASSSPAPKPLANGDKSIARREYGPPRGLPGKGMRELDEVRLIFADGKRETRGLEGGAKGGTQKRVSR